MGRQNMSVKHQMATEEEMLKDVGFEESRGHSSLCQGGVARRQVVGIH